MCLWLKTCDSIGFMETSGAIIGLSQWLNTPAGRYVLEWEQRHLDVAVADLFGFHALQLGMPELDALRANRMPHRWVATDPPVRRTSRNGDADGAATPTRTTARRVAALRIRRACRSPAHSLDLVVLPHALELARDPHQALREVDRVLVPEGRVVMVGFNPTSLWGLRQRLGHLRRRVWRAGHEGLFLPNAGEFMGYCRLRDWLRLLSFEVEAGRFGCYRPPMASQRWLTRLQWMDQAGERWWPVFGALYFVVAVKRVRGMRLVGLARAQRPIQGTAPAVVVNHRHGTRQSATETA